MSKQLYLDLKELVNDIYITTNSISKENEILKISLNNNRNYVYVVDVDADTVVYINDVLQKKVGNVVGQKCYNGLQSSFTKCEFCVNPKLELDTPYSWVHYNDKLKKVFYIIDVLKRIDGQLLKLEKATDITDQLDALEEIINKTRYDRRTV